MEEQKNISFFKGNKEIKVDEKYIRNEIAQFLQLENLNFLIGAGCSSNIVDGTEVGIPGMSKLYSEFFKENPDFQIAGKNVKSIFDGNLEKMLETMGAISIANQVEVVDAEIDKKIMQVQQFIREQVIEGLHGNDILDIYHDFYMKTVTRGRKTPVNIFTTNYDIYNEQALDALSFPYNNGFVGTYSRIFNPASYKYAYVEDMNLSKDVWERVPNFYNLYKIHGSITWVKHDNQIKEVDYHHIAPEDVVMIYPTPLKIQNHLNDAIFRFVQSYGVCFVAKEQCAHYIGI